MDPKRFDRLARTLGKAKLDRRGVAGAVLAVGGLAGAYRLIFAQPACAGDGQSCTIMGGCCDEFVCHVSMVNPNFGACRAGDDILGTGWTFAGMTTLPAVATEIARERRRKKGRNKNRNSNKRNRATATPTTAPTSTPAPTAIAQTPTPDPGDGLTPIPTAGPGVTPPPTDQSVDVAITIERGALDQLTRFRNKGVTNFKVVVVRTDKTCCKPNLSVSVGQTRDLLAGQDRTCERMYEPTGDDEVDVLLSYETAPTVVAYVAFRGYTNGTPAARLAVPDVSCTPR